jgi:hypothetical protein
MAIGLDFMVIKNAKVSFESTSLPDSNQRYLLNSKKVFWEGGQLLHIQSIHATEL